ncbi:hypothetical protein HW49_03470 [Porphyromonadaceae bacterium COT-184 OH4590]|nr:hypothetical protein HW49_03470 [Porphyromonadaceae bacterium COT-184 OH4590]
MRKETITFNVYQIHELTVEAKENAYNHWLNQFNYIWDYENRKTLEQFEQIFNIKANKWSYDTDSYYYRFTSYYSKKEDNLKGIRLLKYLVNNYWTYLFVPKTIWNRSYKKKRNSRVFVTDDCVLTGYYMDYEILRPLYDFMKAPDNTTLYGLMNKCLDNFFNACKDDMAYMVSEEAFEDDCLENNSEFLLNGELYSKLIKIIDQ